jgi:hypothetical protein
MGKLLKNILVPTNIKNINLKDICSYHFLFQPKLEIHDLILWKDRFYSKKWYSNISVNRPLMIYNVNYAMINCVLLKNRFFTQLQKFWSFIYLDLLKATTIVRKIIEKYNMIKFWKIHKKIIQIKSLNSNW